MKKLRLGLTVVLLGLLVWAGSGLARAESAPRCGAERERNDTATTAQPLTGCVRGALAGGLDQDWYRLTATAPLTLTLQGLGDVDLYLYAYAQPAARPLAAAESAANGESLSVAPGDYYVLVQPGLGVGSAYTLTAEPGRRP